MSNRPGSVTAADVESAVRLAVAVLSEAQDLDWDAKAGSLDWTCWETIEHIADNLFFFAAHLGPQTPSTDVPLPFAWTRQRPGGPGLVLFADRAAGTAGLVRIVEACGGLLAAMVRTTPPGVRAYQQSGVLDTEGFAAMGITETLLHMNDVAEGLALTWAPPDDVCARVLGRLFPDAPTDTDPWPTLLWSTGRAELPQRPRLTQWRYGTP